MMKFCKQYIPFSRISRKERNKEVRKPEESMIETRSEEVDAVEDFFWKNKFDTIDATKYARTSYFPEV